MNKASMNICIQIFFVDIKIYFSGINAPKVKRLDSMVVAWLVF